MIIEFTGILSSFVGAALILGLIFGLAFGAIPYCEWSVYTIRKKIIESLHPNVEEREDIGKRFYRLYHTTGAVLISLPLFLLADSVLDIFGVNAFVVLSAVPVPVFCVYGVLLLISAFVCAPAYLLAKYFFYGPDEDILSDKEFEAESPELYGLYYNDIAERKAYFGEEGYKEMCKNYRREAYGKR